MHCVPWRGGCPWQQRYFLSLQASRPLTGGIAHPSVLGLGNFWCYSLVSIVDPDIFSSASIQAPPDHCVSARQRGCFCIGDAILLCCPPSSLQRCPGNQWCMERDGWLPSRGCEREDAVCLLNRAAHSILQTILWIFKR